MKANKLHTLWIIILSLFYTALATGGAIYKSLIKKFNRPWADKVIQRWADRVLNLVQVKYKVINPYGVLPELNQPTIIMCNHTSLYDIPLSFKAFPENSIRMLSKKELSKIPIMGGGMRKSGFPFIDRKNRHQAIKDLAEVKKLMASGIVIWVAPEGTRSKDGKLAPFKKGGFITAIEADATIIPIGIRGAYNILPSRTTCFNLGQEVEIHVGQPVKAALYGKEELRDKVFGIMKELVND